MSSRSRVLASAAALTLGSSTLAQAQDLPPGDGKALIEGACTACHENDLITGSVGYTQENWRHLFGQMIDLPDPAAAQIAGYLAEHYPPSGEREPNLVTGEVEVSFQEWSAPTLGQRPRDPFMHTDGTIWWAGMWGSLVGNLDPETGEMFEIRLDPTARPHSVIEGPDGDIWYTGNGNGTIGRIDYDTHEITVYPLDNPEVRDPHTMVWAEDDTLWFTVQHSNYIGRLDPESGDIWFTQPPTERARPYGARRDSQGMIWIAYRGAYKLARLNPETREITEFETPKYGRYPGLGHYIRRLAIDSRDNVWYVDSGRGGLGRFNPRTGEFTEWDSPSGVDSHPYAIEVIDDIVWYNESDMRPDALVRFDPAAETFQSWPIPSGVGIIRNMHKTPDGNLVIHQSSTNTVGLALIGENGPRRTDIRISQR